MLYPRVVSAAYIYVIYTPPDDSGGSKFSGFIDRDNSFIGEK
jgi:hypothetical protein